MNFTERTHWLCVMAIAAPLFGGGCVSGLSRQIRTDGNRDGGTAADSVKLGPPEPLILAEATGPNPIEHTAGAACASSLSAQESWFQRDKADFLTDFCNDLESLFTRQNAVILLSAGGVSYASHETLDDDVAANTARHENRWGSIQDVIADIGNPITHLAAASGIYAYGLMTDDVELHELGKTLLHATAITAVSSTLLKYAANTERPNGDPRGWPSGHAASSFAVAAVLDEYYGCEVAIPAYAIAGLVAWERIDDREHDLSDVLFGAAFGYVIGRTVAAEHHGRFCGMTVEPYVDPVSGASGVAFERRF